MKGTTFKRCGCRNPETGKSYDTKCPEIAKKNHGAWWARYDAPPDADGKRRRPRIGPYKTKRDAEEALAEALTLASRTGQVISRTLQVGPYLDQWLTSKKRTLKPSTWESYAEAVSLYLTPGLGHLRLVDLRDQHVAELYDEMLRLNRPMDGKPSEMHRRLVGARADSAKSLSPGEVRGKKSVKPLSPARVKRVNAVLSSAMNTAWKKKLLSHNPIEHVDLPHAPRVRPLVWTAERVARWEEKGAVPSPVMVWTPEQTGAFLDFVLALEERLYPMYHLVAYRGLRRAEAAGLPWTDTALEKATVTVRETRPDDDEEAGETKTEAGDRTISLDAETARVLIAWRSRQRRERMRLGAAWVDSGRVFTREDGAALRPTWISTRFAALIERYGAVRERAAEGWSVSEIAKRHRMSETAVKVALEAGPLPPIRFHDLRHGAATLSLAAGVDMKVISTTLGHARSAFTSDVYTSVIPQVAQAAAEAVAGIVPRRNGPTSAPQDENSASAEVI